jgi:hypothetical protein
MMKGKTRRRIRIAETHLAMYICFLSYVEQGGNDSYRRWCHTEWPSKKEEWQAK